MKFRYAACSVILFTIASCSSSKNEVQDDDDMNQKLQSFMQARASASGVELILKYRTKTDDPVFLHLFTINENGKLFLAIIDQRECGA